MIDNILRQVSEEFNISEELVEEAYSHHIKWLAKTLKECNHPAILNSGLGTYYVSWKRLDGIISTVQNSKIEEIKDKLPVLLELKEKVHKLNRQRKKFIKKYK